MTTNWRDKWQERTRGGRAIHTIEDYGDYLEVFPADGGRYPVYPVYPTGRHSTDRETPHDLLPITPPAAPVPQGYAEITIGGVKTLAKMDTASSLVVEHHVSGGTLMMVADDLANLRRDAERWQYENKQLRLILQSAKHLLMAATGPEDGPTSWIETRDRLFDRMKTYSVDALPDPAT